MDFEEDPDALGMLPRDWVYPDESEIGPLSEIPKSEKVE